MKSKTKITIEEFKNSMIYKSYYRSSESDHPVTEELLKKAHREYSEKFDLPIDHFTLGARHLPQVLNSTTGGTFMWFEVRFDNKLDADECEVIPKNIVWC